VVLRNETTQSIAIAYLACAHRYPHEGEELDDLESDVEGDEVFDHNEGDSVVGKGSQGKGSQKAADAQPGSMATPNASAHGSAHDTPPFEEDVPDDIGQPLPEEEPELIGTPKAPKVELSHDAPLHANSQSLFKSLRGWLFGDDSDEEAKVSGDNAFTSNSLRNRDAVLAHALRVEGWKKHAEHFTGAVYTGNLDHADQPDK
jgi:hypothetical protein